MPALEEITVTLTHEEAEQLKQLAEEECRSVDQQARLFIKQKLEILREVAASMAQRQETGGDGEAANA
ncbi:MAG TPA: hypothetical protein VEY08_17775 [Chloroflexia bacterium]|nr:hypothetical protein [Chloroflexia bacterium]